MAATNFVTNRVNTNQRYNTTVHTVVFWFSQETRIPAKRVVYVQSTLTHSTSHVSQCLGGIHFTQMLAEAAGNLRVYRLEGYKHLLEDTGPAVFRIKVQKVTP